MASNYDGRSFTLPGANSPPVLTIDAVARAGAARPTPGKNPTLIDIDFSDRRAARVWKNLFSRDLLSLFLSLSRL